MWPFDAPYPLSNISDFSDCQFDYIVVGGGTAGCAVASRLSEQSDVTVLVVEKGPVKDTWLSRVPLASVASGSYLTHRKATTQCYGENGEANIYTGEALGGTSRVNGLVYTRGVPAYYDQWAQSGHPDWSWSNVRPYYDKIETRRGKLHQDQSRKGPLHLLQHEPMSEIEPTVGAVAKELGLRCISDINNPDSPAMGLFHLDLTIQDTGYRDSALQAYLPLQVAKDRHSRLRICANTIVTRLDVDGVTGMVHGVFVKDNSGKHLRKREIMIKATREVILCGGCICTPQILQLSGIGPRSLLEQFKITVQHDLQGVGAHLQDRSAVPVFIEVPAEQTIHSILGSSYQAIKHLLMFATTGSGWFKTSMISRAIYLNTKHLDTHNFSFPPLPEQALDASAIANIPDAEIMVIPVSTDPITHTGKNLLTLQTCLNQPKSIGGAVAIKSSNPEEDPDINLGILTDQQDIDTMRKAIRFSLHLAERFTTSPYFPHSAQLFHGKGPKNPGNWRDLGDDDLDKYIRANVTSVYHLTSSCRMGREEDGGVVNGKLRVHGFKNLRIADASVFPTMTPGHPMAPVYMIAERCADFVKEEWEGKNHEYWQG